MGSDLTRHVRPPRAVNGVSRRLADSRPGRGAAGVPLRDRPRRGSRDLVDWWRANRHASRRAAAIERRRDEGSVRHAPGSAAARPRPRREVIASGWLTQGPQVEEFEQDFARARGRPGGRAPHELHHRAAPRASRRRRGTGRRGDRTVSLSFIATANAVWHCGATPVFADIDPETLQPRSRTTSSAGSRRARSAIIPFTRSACPATWSGSSARRAHTGSRSSRTQRARSGRDQSTAAEPIGGRSADIACFSFHPRKVITSGEGGMLTTANPRGTALPAVAPARHGSFRDATATARARSSSRRYSERGFNNRMTDIQAAIGREQLRPPPGDRRGAPRARARYRELLGGIAGTWPAAGAALGALQLAELLRAPARRGAAARDHAAPAGPGHQHQARHPVRAPRAALSGAARTARCRARRRRRTAACCCRSSAA